ncbi:hypothetical protein CCR80_09595 [Rhodothalassium salexigens]|uniref:Ig-like domain-containing protein n=1 Tax=Rhodothalassium salexigens TaxID=1086 RepID=UPI0019132C6B|nr:Ig-like domain-containing protein [Rhodothalassium salexigens]MBK5921282.1 hypothetical protein [Rhodothalassium salexigens]
MMSETDQAPETLAQQVDDLRPGSWAQIDASNIFFDVAVTREEHDRLVEQAGAIEDIYQGGNFWGWGGPKIVFRSWNSGAYDAAENRMFFFGGGHNNYGGNEVYSFDFDTLEWSRLSDPIPYTLPDQNSNDTNDPGDAGRSGFVPDRNGDGVQDAPGAPHTYDGLVWNPITQTLWLTTQGGTTFPYNREASFKAAWEFDPQTGEWTAHEGPYNHYFGSTVFLEDTGQILSLQHEKGLAFLINPDGSTVELGEILGDTHIGRLQAATFTNPETGDIYTLSTNGIFELTLQDGQLVSQHVADLPDFRREGFVGDDVDINGLFRSGAAYRPVDGKFYFWNGTKKIVTWDPETNEFELVHNGASEEAPSGQAIGSGRVFEKWVYLDDVDAFAGIAEAQGVRGEGEGGLFIYKPGDNALESVKLSVETLSLDTRGIDTLGVIVPLAGGDEDFDASATLEYREVGAAVWEQGPDPVRLRPDMVSTPQDLEASPAGFAATIAGLDADTSYEIRVTIDDPDGLRSDSAPTVQTLQATTRDMPADLPEQARTIQVDSMKALQAAVDQAQPGDVILVAPGLYEGSLRIRADGTEDNPIVIKGIDRDGTVLDGQGGQFVVRVDGDNVHVEDLSLRNADAGIWVRGNNYAGERTTGVAIRGNKIDDVSDGISAIGGHEDLYIADNILQGRLEPLETVGGGNDEGIVVTGTGILVEHNTVSGFIDSLGISKQTDIANVGISFRNNAVLWGGDDAIELDFAMRHAVAYDNMVANHANGLSFQPVYGGPAYAFDNIFYNIERGPIKISPETDDPAGIFVINNTFVRSGTALTGSSGSVFNVEILNNLFIGDGEQDGNQYTTLAIRDLTEFAFDVRFDHNAYLQDGTFRFSGERGETFEAWRSTGQFGRNDVLLAGEAVFENVPLDFEDTGFAGRFRDLFDASLDFGLADGSSAIDAGVVVNGINNDYAGDAPDIGALERGEQAPEVGARIDVRDPEAPFANRDRVLAERDTPITFDPAANDLDLQGDPLTVVAIGAVEKGRLSLGADGQVTFVPDPGFLGDVSVSYTVADDQGNETVGDIDITVLPPNRAPTAVADTAQTFEGETLSAPLSSLLANDSDPDGDALTVVAMTAQAGGAIDLDGASFTYTPKAGFFGTEVITYTLADGRGGTDTGTLTVSVLSDGSVIGTASPDTIDVSGATQSTTVQARGGPDDVTGSPFDDRISGENGSDTLYGGAGDDLFFYSGDHMGGGDTVDGGAGFDRIQGTAQDDTISLASLGGVEAIDGGAGIDTIQVFHDLDLSAVTVTGIERIDGTWGPQSIVGSSGRDVFYGDGGNDRFDGGAGVDAARFDGAFADYTVTIADKGPWTVRADVTDEGSDTLVNVEELIFKDGTYVPDGKGGFVKVADAQKADNRPPEAEDATQVTGLGQPVLWDLDDLAVDPDGDAIRIEELGAVEHGEVVIEAGNVVRFTPDPDFTGRTSFTYLVSDGNGHTASGTLTVEVRGDLVAGTPGDDVFVPADLSAADGLAAGAGFDQLLGSDNRFRADSIDLSDMVVSGLELIDGRQGFDTIMGSPGDDTIRGGAQDDTLFGVAGDDVFLFEGKSDGTDRIDGGEGFDTVQGASGDDVIRLRSLDGVERIDGGDGEDVLGTWDNRWNRHRLDLSEVEVAGIERIEGGAGFDTIIGSSGDDVIAGGGRADTLTGGPGDDRLDGGEGMDTAVFSGARNAYRFERGADGALVVVDTRTDGDGRDQLVAIETLAFADGDVAATDILGVALAIDDGDLIG